jgi:hypothetical protein
MKRSRRVRKPLFQRLKTWFQSYILFGGRRARTRRRPSRLRRALTGGYRQLSQKLTRFWFPTRRRQSRLARYARTLLPAQKPLNRLQPSRLSTLPLERKIQQLNERFLSWLFSYKPAKKSKRRPSPIPISTPKIYRRLAALRILNPLYWVGWSVDFCVSYLLSRPLATIIPALPALLALLVIPFIIAQTARTDNTTARMRNYTNLYFRAIQANDYETANICNRTLLELDPQSTPYQFERARLEELRGQPAKSREIMESLAFHRQSGQAAAWLVEFDYKLKNVTEWSDFDHTRFKQLMAIIIADPTFSAQKEPHLKLADYFDKTGAPLEALAEIEPLLGSHPELLLTAAEFAKKGNASKSLSIIIPWAKRDLNARLAKSPQNAEILLRLSRILELNGEFKAAEALLIDRLQRTKSKLLTERLVKVLVAHAHQLATAPQSANNVEERIRVLYRAAKLAPNDLRMVEQLRDLLLTLKEEPTIYQAALAEIALQGKELKGLALIRACLLLLDQNESMARFDLQLAARDGIDIAPLLNNLAVALAEGENPDLLRALPLANAAVNQFPNPYFWETRGQILFRLKRYRDSVIDLEKAAKHPLSTTLSSRSLVIANQILGNSAPRSLKRDDLLNPDGPDR